MKPRWFNGNHPQGLFLRNIHLGGKTHQKGQFLPNRVAFRCKPLHFVVSPYRKIIAFGKKGTFSRAKQAQLGGNKPEEWGRSIFPSPPPHTMLKKTLITL